jgi:hypothetical protein
VLLRAKLHSYPQHRKLFYKRLTSLLGVRAKEMQSLVPSRNSNRLRSCGKKAWWQSLRKAKRGQTNDKHPNTSWEPHPHESNSAPLLNPLYRLIYNKVAKGRAKRFRYHRYYTVVPYILRGRRRHTPHLP